MHREDFELKNAREFLHSSYKIWLKNLFHHGSSYKNKQEMASDVGKNRQKMLYFLIGDSHAFYDFTDEDGSAKSRPHFPGNKAFMTIIKTLEMEDVYELRDKTEKGLLKFLNQNNKYLENVNDYYTAVIKGTINEFDQEELSICKFEERLSFC